MREQLNKELELFTELLASEQMGGYSDLNLNLTEVLSQASPSMIWDHLKYNPWISMAVFEDMEEKDSRIFSCLDVRKINVLSKSYHIEPASDSPADKKIAEFVGECLTTYFGKSNSIETADESPFESFLYEALDAIPKGVSIGEIIWAEAKDRIYVQEVKFKPQHLFAFGGTDLASFSTATQLYPQTGRLRLRSGVKLDDPLGAELPEHKFFVFSYRPRYGNRWGSPLLRKVYWQSWIKRNSITQWLKYQEKGSGVVIAKYNDTASEAEQSNALQAATAVQEESAVAIPKKFLLEVHEMVRNIGSSHKELVDDFCNSEIALAILGQTLTSRGSDGGGSRALGEVHERVADRISEVDAKSLMAVVNKRIVRPIVLLNFGPEAKCPTWMIDYESQEDLTAVAKRLGILRKDVGLPLPQGHVYELMQLPEPKDEEDTIGGVAKVEVEPEEDPLDAKELTEFGEKKTLNGSSPGKSAGRSSSKTERFRRLRPSMIRFSGE